jgi:hypothetical protein
MKFEELRHSTMRDLRKDRSHKTIVQLSRSKTVALAVLLECLLKSGPPRSEAVTV